MTFKCFQQDPTQQTGRVNTNRTYWRPRLDLFLTSIIYAAIERPCSVRFFGASRGSSDLWRTRSANVDDSQRVGYDLRCKVHRAASTMHDTAFHIGTLAMNIYADLKNAAVLEIGSQALNGSLRDNVVPTTRYIGVDIEEGDGVDVVVEPGKPLPLGDDSFDFVMASSVFEHDPCFWMTFLEMCRTVKEGGYIYINAPSNGVVHRFPQDNWRFYPDSGRALVRWAISQGQPVTLVESFIAERENDVWNDFVAVFRKGRITKTLPQVFVHEHVPCSNVITWKSQEILNPRAETEDMMLLAEAANQRDSLAEKVKNLDDKLTEAAEQDGRHRAELQRLVEKLAESDQAREELRLRENELRQRQEEIEQTRSELDKSRSELARLGNELAQTRSERDDLRSRLTGLEQRLTDWTGRYERAQAELKDAWAAAEASEVKLSERRQELARITELLRTRETELRTEKSAADVRLTERFREIATLSSMLIEQETQARRSSEEAAWLAEVTCVLANGSTTPKGRLLAMLPASLQQKRHRRILKRGGLFDGDAYLAANPDVAAEGEDPLTHYLRHGIKENRRRG